MSKRKVVAWLLLRHDAEVRVFGTRSEALAVARRLPVSTQRVLPVVEHDPEADAVVWAAIRFLKTYDEIPLAKAVYHYRRKHAKRVRL